MLFRSKNVHTETSNVRRVTPELRESIRRLHAPIGKLRQRIREMLRLIRDVRQRIWGPLRLIRDVRSLLTLLSYANLGPARAHPGSAHAYPESAYATSG